ncbi:Ccc1 family, partial [Clohesyomyces aquaticus]
HHEKHTEHGAVVRDAIIGFADGLTVPFALTAGLSSIGSSKLVIIGGLAELFAGSISMGLGAYLAALTEKKHYEVEEERERREVEEMPEAEEEEIYEIFQPYGVKRETVRGVVEELKEDKESWVRFMMQFELNLVKPKVSRLYISALVMGLSYLLGGLIPMIPYFAIPNVTKALFVSIGITVVMLLSFGYVKAIVTGTTRKAAVWSAFQTLAVGVLAAAASYGIVRGIDKA